ncbi:hypothetical protein [Pedobacter punctiformis]|uniref:Uncharacterized protein n=1 Tax=Pedobacter punctiformis TaxID=3004097 RepID=A0ABT4L997_9SPHI|nr:hypothetical protein [Pedobacter sp. HCMS5-2]MCZ4244465.1 hypothetical protein [Pedobacter sp. HCMS5-2]
MKLRITPLNIVAAISAVVAIYLFIKPVRLATPGYSFNFNGLMASLLVGLVVVSFITDLIFRFTLKDLKRIWIVEMVFIVIAIILMLILQKVV